MPRHKTIYYAISGFCSKSSPEEIYRVYCWHSQFHDFWQHKGRSDRLSANYKPGRHIAIAACRSHQTAKEYTGEDGSQRGVFSYEQAYCAVVTSLPLPQLKVDFQGDATGVELASLALSTANYGRNSLFVTEVAEWDANYYMQAKLGQYWIKKA